MAAAAPKNDARGDEDPMASSSRELEAPNGPEEAGGGAAAAARKELKKPSFRGAPSPPPAAPSPPPAAAPQFAGRTYGPAPSPKAKAAGRVLAYGEAPQGPAPEGFRWTKCDPVAWGCVEVPSSSLVGRWRLELDDDDWT